MEEKKDKLSGQFEESKGNLKEGVGAATDNERLEGEGKVDQAGGKLKQGVAAAKEKAGELIDKATGDDK